tara:strand:- start:188 stop:361 length:174 start_codon:yes stop_codon:yes gene_type:complete
MNKYRVVYSDKPGRLAGGERLEKHVRRLGASSPSSIKAMPMFKGLHIISITKLGKWK